MSSKPVPRVRVPANARKDELIEIKTLISHEMESGQRKDAAGAILYAAETATKLALDAIQLLGGNGYINEYPTGRLLRDAKLYEIGAGTSEIRRWLIGRELFSETA